MFRLRRAAPGARIAVATLTVVSLLALSGNAVPTAPGSGGTLRVLPPSVGTPSPAPIRSVAIVPATPHASAGATVLSSPGATPSVRALQWTASAAVFFGNYTVLESTNGSDGPWRLAAAVTDETTASATLPSLAPGSAYWWEVETYSGLTDTGSVSNVLATVQPPLAVLNVTLPTSTNATLNWTNNATYGGGLGFAAYEVFESVNGGAPTALATLTDANRTTFAITDLAPSSSYDFYVNTSDCYADCGTDTALTAVTQSNVVTAGTPRALVASVSAERPIVDVGEADYFTCTPSGGVSPYAFAWAIGNGSFDAGAAALSTGFAAAGPVLVTCKITDSGAAVAESAASVLVNAALALNASLNRTSADTGQSVGYSCLVSGGTAPYTVSWSFGDGNGLLEANASHAYAAPGTYAPSCDVVDDAGASALSARSISVNETPSATLNVSALAAAPGTTLVFGITFANGTPPFSGVQVNFADGTIGEGASVSHAFHLVGNYTVRGRGRDANGVAAADTAIVRISALSAVIAFPKETMVAGTAYLFSDNASGGAGGPYNVTWQIGGASTAYGSRASLRLPVGSDHVTAVTRDRLGAATFSNFTIPVTAPPVAPGPAPPNPWLLLIPAAAVGAFVTAVAYRSYRRREQKELAGAAQYVLPTDPERTLTGVRTCKNCGTTNNAVRETCSTCGATLGHPLFG